jgi:hypothetical protein
LKTLPEVVENAHMSLLTNGKQLQTLVKTIEENYDLQISTMLKSTDFEASM